MAWLSVAGTGFINLKLFFDKEFLSLPAEAAFLKESFAREFQLF